MTCQRPSHADWLDLLAKIETDLDGLDQDDLQWLEARLAAIHALQTALDDLFVEVAGAVACADCDGACCGSGLHHLTLTNLLGYLVAGEIPPAPVFSRTCPFLGDHGCELSATRRPYNCITFFCERLEEALGEQGRIELRSLDRRLRSEYQAVAERLPAASLRGIWIALERIGDGETLLKKQ